MVRRRLLPVLLLTLTAAGVPRTAETRTRAVDPVPAATLLLPYFEVDLENPDGVTTLFSINNASASAVLAHVVLWSDLSVPVLDFNLYLTGYDVQSVNLRDVLVHGVLPRTASVGQDPQDVLSPGGSFSEDVNHASCTGQLPLPDLPQLFRDHLQNALTGRFSALLGGCAGLLLGDRIARGYVTVDVVGGCTLRFPGDPGYFVSGGNGDARNDNVLWGDFFFLDPGGDSAAGDTLVHVEADASDPETSLPGQYTFYGRYVGWTAADNREPLATNFAARFLNGGVFDGGTDLIAWRDSKVAQGAFPCGTVPSWFPLGQENLVVFDEEENPSRPLVPPVSPPPPDQGVFLFPAEAFRTPVGGAFFPVPFDFGWLYLDLNQTVPAAGANPPEDPAGTQGWVTVLSAARGLFSVGYHALSLDSATRPHHSSDVFGEPAPGLCESDLDRDGVPDCFDCRPRDPRFSFLAVDIACNGLDENCDCDPTHCNAAFEDCMRSGRADCFVLLENCTELCGDPSHSAAQCEDGKPPNVCQIAECDGAKNPAHPIHCTPRTDGSKPAGCAPTACMEASCQGGQCRQTPKPAGTNCGSTACTTATCDGSGQCVVSHQPAGTLCTSDSNPCTDQKCDGAGACKTTFVARGTPCGLPGDPCKTCSSLGSCLSERELTVVGTCPAPVATSEGCSVTPKKRCFSGKAECRPVAARFGQEGDYCTNCGEALEPGNPDPAQRKSCGICPPNPCGPSPSDPRIIGRCMPSHLCNPSGAGFLSCQRVKGCTRIPLCWFPEDVERCFN